MGFHDMPKMHYAWSFQAEGLFVRQELLPNSIIILSKPKIQKTREALKKIDLSVGQELIPYSIIILLAGQS